MILKLHGLFRVATRGSFWNTIWFPHCCCWRTVLRPEARTTWSWPSNRRWGQSFTRRFCPVKRLAGYFLFRSRRRYGHKLTLLLAAQRLGHVQFFRCCSSCWEDVFLISIILLLRRQFCNSSYVFGKSLKSPMISDHINGQLFFAHCYFQF